MESAVKEVCIRQGVSFLSSFYQANARKNVLAEIPDAAYKSAYRFEEHRRMRRPLLN